MTPELQVHGIVERVGAENPVTLCDPGILVDLVAEPVPAEIPDVCAWSSWLPTPGRRTLLQRPVPSANGIGCGRRAEQL